jgi:hypothetical protein
MTISNALLFGLKGVIEKREKSNYLLGKTSRMV